MKVYAWVKYKLHPKPENGGSTRGDISYFWPINAPQGKLTMDTFVPFVVDLKIPCGEGKVKGMDFAVKDNQVQWKCSQCPFDDLADCDIQKYNKGIWGNGTVLDPPKMIKKHGWYINIEDHIDSSGLLLVEMTDKLPTDEATILDRAQNNEIVKTAILEKA